MSGHPLDDVTVTMPKRLAASVLFTLVSGISERCYCAGWMSGVEEALEKRVPAALETGEPQPWGQDEVGTEEAIAIKALVDALGGWQAAWDIDAACL